MTLNDMIVAALAQLDRGHDAQTIETWRARLTRFANEGAADLAYAVKLRRTDTVTSDDGTVDLDSLPRPVVRLTKVERGGREVKWDAGEMSRVISTGAAGDIKLTYQCLPAEMENPTDVPEIPERYHGLLVAYMVGRERMSGDADMQRGGTVYLSMYEAGRKRILSQPDIPNAYSFLNRW